MLLALNISAQIIVYTADFQNGLPSDFTFLNLDGNTPVDASYNAPWICVSDPENPTDSVVSSTSYFEIADTANRWMITPPLALGSFGNQIAWQAKSQDASFPDDYYVLVSTTDNAPESFTDTIGYIEGENFEWADRFVDLSEEGYNDQSIYVAFVLRTYDGFKLYINDITVIKEDETGIAANGFLTFNTFPNPVNSKLIISCELGIDKIVICDLNGREVHSGRTNTLNVQALKPGTYFIHVTTAIGSSTKQFIKN